MKIGEKDDVGGTKDRWDLVSWPAIQQIVDALTYGARVKRRADGAAGYGDRNWEGGLDYGRVFGALMRHLLKAWHRVSVDPESGLPNMAHAGACWMFLTHYMLHPERYRRFDDRPVLHTFRRGDRFYREEKKNER